MMLGLLKGITFCLLLQPATVDAGVAVIAHPSVPTAEVTSAELLDFYAGDVKVWSTGEAVILFDLKPKTEVKSAFYRFLGKTTSRMKSIWMKRLLSGEGKPPEALGSDVDMLAKVAATPGAIGYVDEAAVNGASGPRGLWAYHVIVIAVIPTDDE